VIYVAGDTVRTRVVVRCEGNSTPDRAPGRGELIWLRPSAPAPCELAPIRVERFDGSSLGGVELAQSEGLAEALEHSAPLPAVVQQVAARNGGAGEWGLLVQFSLPRNEPGFQTAAGDNRPASAVAIFEPVEETPTAGYPHPYPFPRFNPVQSAVLRIRQNPHNIVIAANTSAGKTVAAELLMDHVLAQGRKVIYLSPLKALTEEKRAEWALRYAGRLQEVLTGDYEAPPDLVARLEAAEIVLMTSEMLDCRTRKFQSEGNFWMRQVGLVVVDEAHILAMDRGDGVEAGLMRFTRCCPTARIALLSATASNVEELAAWLKVLNGMPGDLVYSTYRPVDLERHYLPYERSRTPGGAGYQETENNKIEIALRLALSKPSEKFLIFVHSKQTGRRLLKALGENSVSAEFHNADLDLEKRRGIEESFKERAGGIRVLVSTKTTAWGVNLPARNVVIVGVHCGIQQVDELDIIQMAGRAGRLGHDPKGDVYLIVEKGKAAGLEKAFLKPRPVTSILKNWVRLGFHILAEIYAGGVRTRPDILRWYARSLSHRQRIPFSPRDDAAATLKRLEGLNMIHAGEDFLRLTPLGVISAVMYFHPVDIDGWRKNFNRLFRQGLEHDDAALAWAMAAVWSRQEGTASGEAGGIQTGWNVRIRELGLIPRLSTHLWVEAAYSCLKKTRAHPLVETKKREFSSDAARILNALRIMDERYARWGKAPLWKQLEQRLAAKKARRPSKPPARALGEPPSRVVLKSGVVFNGCNLLGEKALGLVAELASLDGGCLKELTFRPGRPSDPLFHIDPEGGFAALNLERIWRQAVESLDAESDPGAAAWLIAWHTLLGAATACLLHIKAAAAPDSAWPPGISERDLKAHFAKRMRELCGQFDVEPPPPAREPFFGKKLAEFQAASAGDPMEWARPGTSASYRDQILAAVGPADEPAPSTSRLSQPSILDHVAEKTENGF
jgi:superfamily II DNA or RNA helicase